jgi:transcriptional regulator with XRE-family HTH domain
MSKIRPNNFDAGAAAAARAAAGLTQQQVADAVGKTKALVQHWEAGRRQPYPEITRALADLYGVDVEDLLVSPLELAMADMATVRRAQRISVDEMAERIGVSTRSIEQVEAGARMPDDPITWAVGYKVSLPALATAWRNTPPPIAESLAPVGGRQIEPGPTSPVTTALATAYDAEPERLQVSAPDLDHDDLGMVRRRARISGEQMAMRVMTPGDPAPKLRELYRVEAATYLPPDPVRWARAYGLSVRALAACWRRGWIGPHGGAGKHTVDLRDSDDRPTGRPGRG